MLTAILTHHLGWVGTVAPLSLHSSAPDSSAASSSRSAADHSPSSPASNPYLTANLARLERAKMSEISKFHPYNVLWAQMSDLYGAIGSPPKLSKTIVCGSQEPLIEKVLNVLTYFIRCGQIERDIRTELFDKLGVEDSLAEHAQQTTRANTASPTVTPTMERSSMRRSGKGAGMSRSSTCLKDLTSMVQPDDNTYEPMQTSKKNDIPNVLIFRDSRFVKQELRIGNLLMDTGIEMTRKQRSDISDYRVKHQSELAAGGIRVMVTNPDLEEFTVNDAASNSSSSIDDSVEEVTESYGKETCPSLSYLITANSLGNGIVEGATCPVVEPIGLMWGLESFKEGVSVEQIQHTRKGEVLNLKNGHCVSLGSNEDASVDETKTSKSLFAKSSSLMNPEYLRRTKMVHHQKGVAELAAWESESLHDEHEEEDIENIDPAPPMPNKLKAYPSLSDLITANSVGASDRLTWGIELVKEGVTMDEVQHFQNSQKRIEDNSRKDPGVVFVLGGDNESLTNLKLSAYTKHDDAIRKSGIIAGDQCGPSFASKPPAASAQSITATTTARKTCSHKKHSGVKFNFEKYPQIATNYMKNKNIDLNHYDFIEKGHKLDTDAPSSTVAADFPMSSALATITDDSDNSECECCGAGNATRILLQTPSNATELEFNNDDNNYPTSTTAASTSKLIAAASKYTNSVLVAKTQTSVAAKESKAAASKIEIITLPLSKCVAKLDAPAGQKLVAKGTFGSATRKMQRPGFIPSLFVGITDHFIADMVLQVRMQKVFNNCHYFKGCVFRREPLHRCPHGRGI